MQIRIQLSTIHKKDNTVTDYFYKVKQLADTIASIGQPLEDEVTIYMLAGLDSDFDSFIGHIDQYSNRTDLFGPSLRTLARI